MNKQYIAQLLAIAENSYKLKNFDVCEPLLHQILAADDKNARAYELLAYIYAGRGNADQFERFLMASCQFEEASPAALYHLGSHYLEGGQFEKAKIFFEKSLLKAGDFFEALHDLGTAQAQLGLLDEAQISYCKALECNKGSPELHFNLARLCDEQKNFPKALTYYDEAIRLQNDYVEAWSNRGVVLANLQRYSEALESYSKALQINPLYAEAWSNKGVSFFHLKLYREALESYSRAVEIDPQYAQAWSNTAATLHELKRYNDAILAYERALDRNPNLDYVHGELVHAKMKICDWRGIEFEFELVRKKIEQGKLVSSPFPLLAFFELDKLNYLASKLYAESIADADLSLAPAALGNEHHKIKIGYYSSDFHNHATSYLMAEFFELHDKSQFELVAFSFGINVEDAMRQRLTSSFDQFIDVSELSDSAIVQLSREIEIDIAVDLKGYTQDSRPGIFVHRAAPIQINYLGYPGTLGSKYYDYIVADEVVIPSKSQEFFSEKIIYLPNSYQVNDRNRVISSNQFTRESAGLPSGAFIFCCFNNNYKITPSIFDSWARILKAVPDSILWLLEDNALAKENLMAEFSQRGLSGERLIFAPRMNLEDHLGRHKLADLFLDTLPCNAHTTASDSLWAGLPVLTQMGETFSGRVSSSLLRAIELPELITHSREEYEAVAIELACNRKRLQLIKEELQANRLKAPLFDTPLFVANIESAYRKIYQRQLAKMPPETIYID